METKAILVRLAGTCKKNDQHKDDKLILNYRTNGRRRLGRPLKKLSDEAETGPIKDQLVTDEDDDKICTFVSPAA